MATFPRAKLCRFNEVPGCAPPPGTYEPLLTEKPILGHFDRSNRFIEPKTPAHAPGTYQGKLIERPRLGHFNKSERFVEPKAPAPRPQCQQSPQRERRHSLDMPGETGTRGSTGLRRSHSVYNPQPRRMLTTIKRRDKACSCDIKEPPVEKCSKAVWTDISCGSCTKYKIEISAQERNICELQRNIRELQERLRLQTDRVVCEVAKQEAMCDLLVDLDNKVVDYRSEIKELQETNVEIRTKVSSNHTEILSYRLQICSMADSIDELTASRNQVVMQKNQYMDDILCKEDEIFHSEAKIKMLKDDLTAEENKNIKLRKEVEEISKELLISHESIMKLSAELDQEKSARTCKENANKQLLQNLQKANYENEMALKRAREENVRVTDELCLLQKELLNKESETKLQLENMKILSNDKDMELNRVKEEHVRLTDKLCLLQSKLDDKGKEIDYLLESLKNINDEKETEHNIAKEEHVRLTDKVCLLQGELDDKEKKIEQLLESVRNLGDEKETELNRAKEEHVRVTDKLSLLQGELDDKEKEIEWVLESLKEVKIENERELTKTNDEHARVTNLLCHLQEQSAIKDQLLNELHRSQDETIAKYNYLQKKHEEIIKNTIDTIIQLLDGIKIKFGWSEFDENEGRHIVTSSSQILDTDRDNMVHKYIADLRVAVGRVAGSLVAYRDQNEMMERELGEKHDQIHELELLIGPFREQLEFFEQERKALTDVTSKTKKELEEIALQQAASLGHQNHKQKIRYLVQLKEANLRLKNEVNALQAKLRQKDRTIWKLSKESVMNDNSTPCGLAVCGGKENSAKK